MDKIITNEPYEIIRLSSHDKNFAIQKAWRESLHKNYEPICIMLNKREARDIAESILEELK